jgi:hypothetical protein
MVPQSKRLLIAISGVSLLIVQLAKPADNAVQFSGLLEAVTHHTIAIRLPDGRVVDAGLPDSGELASQSLFLKYRMGDLVEIKGHVVSIPRGEPGGYFPLRDAETGVARNLELDQIGFVRAPSSDELSTALGSGARLVKGNLLTDPTRPREVPDVSLRSLKRPSLSANKEAGDAALERTRTLVHQYLAALPNFVADSKTILYRSPGVATPKWTVNETLEAETHFRGGSETRMSVVRNGVQLPDNALLPSAVRAQASTTNLSHVFNPDCPVSLEFEKRAVEAGTPVLVYRFKSPHDSCFGADWDGDYQYYFAPHEGEILVGEADGLIREIDCISTEYPNEFAQSRIEERVTWGEVRIGDERHLLPVSSEMLQVSKRSISWSVAEYSNHRHFETSSTVTYH